MVSAVGDSSGRDVAERAFRQHRTQVYRFLLRKTGNHHEAEELTQRVFADAASAFGSARPEPKALLAWLYTVAERRFIDEVRRRVVARQGFELLPRGEEAPDLTHSREITHALKRAINNLPEDQRAVMIMKVLEGRRFAEIAAALGTTEAACKMRLSRAVARLKRDLRDQGLQP
jgi:RNA polymerase sigma-70 factor, ECF subfamily